MQKLCCRSCHVNYTVFFLFFFAIVTLMVSSLTISQDCWLFRWNCIDSRFRISSSSHVVCIYCTVVCEIGRVCFTHWGIRYPQALRSLNVTVWFKLNQKYPDIICHFLTDTTTVGVTGEFARITCHFEGPCRNHLHSPNLHGEKLYIHAPPLLLLL